MKKLMGWEILQEYKKGRRDFSNISIFIGEFAGADLSGIIFRNCKIEDATFRGGKLIDADFSGSEIIFSGFNDTNLTRAKFNNCYIKWASFDRAIVEDTEIKNSELIWCVFLNTNIACIDFSNSRQYRNVTDISQMTEEGIREAVREFGTYLNKVDFEKRLHMRVIANRLMRNYGLKEQMPSTPEAAKNKTHSNVNLYSKLLSSMIEGSISAYSQSHPYTQKSHYTQKKDKKDSYGVK